MTSTPRRRFILIWTLAYLAFALGWIFLSDQLLGAFADMQSMVWLSTAKGFFFVFATAAIFMMAMNAVPSADADQHDSMIANIVAGASNGTYPRWISYLAAVILPLIVLAMRVLIFTGTENHPLVIVLMLPIILSTLLGGLWPGLLSTALCTMGAAYYLMAPLHSFAVANSLERLQLGFLVLNGLGVSILSEALRHSLQRANAQRYLLDAVVSGTSDAVFVKDLRGRYLFINAAGAQFVGKPASAVVGHDDTSLFPPESARTVMDTDRCLMADGTTSNHLEEVSTLGGEYLAFSVSKGPVRDASGQTIGMFGISRDITQSRKVEVALQASEAAMRNTQRLAGIGNWVWDLETGAQHWSDEVYRIYGIAPGQSPPGYAEVQKYFTADSWPRMAAAVDKCQIDGIPFACDGEMVHANGDHRWVTVRGEILEGAAGRPTRLQGSLQDITERKLAELALSEAATVFTNSYEGIMVVGTNRRITRVNPAFTRITGYSLEEVMGQSPALLSSGRHGKDFYAELWKSMQEQGFWRGEIWNKRKNGEIYPELLAISEVRDASGTVLHYTGMFWDLSESKAHAAEIDRIAHYDPLTGSPNRRLLVDRLARAIEHAERNAKSLAVCFLDLDGFKEVNDLYGHEAGDQLLIGVAEHLKQVLRSDDTLARLGGDEFVLLLSDIGTPRECAAILKRVLKMVAKPVAVNGHSVSISASIGVSLYPQDHSDADTLLRHADQAMFLAKESGKNQFQLFDPESNVKAQQRIKELTELRIALERGEFVLFYQPKVDLMNGRIVGVEALIRWQHPQRGLLSPAEFLPTINDSDLERPLGEWVIHTALAQAARWLGEGMEIRVSVNVSAHHLLHPDFCKFLHRALAMQPQVNPANFELEVLETAAIADMDLAVTILNQCHAFGVHFSLDDFGTGYSSLTYLRKLPVDVLKIDQSFVRGMLDNPDDRGIVQGVIQLADAFGRQVIAEGVETMAHGAALLAMNCRLAQGYGIARPMANAQFLPWCTQWKLDQRWIGLAP